MRAINSKDEMDIVLVEDIDGMGIMYNELAKCGLFNNVYFFDDVYYRLFNSYIGFSKFYNIKNNSKYIKNIVWHVFVMFKKLFEYIKLQHKSKKINLPEKINLYKYDEIYINDCTSTLNFYLYNKKFKNLIHVEHAQKIMEPMTIIIILLKLLEKLHITYGLRGTCRFIKALEVSDKNNINPYVNKRKEIRIMSNEELLNNLLIKQREYIYKLYAKAYKFDFLDNLNINVYLTSNLDEIYNNKKNQNAICLSLCENIINEFKDNVDLFIIKPHPRDLTDYSNIHENVLIIPSCVSAEVFALNKSLKINKLICINTSSSNAFLSVKEKRILGIEYVKKIIKDI